ncbi:twin-arginine translocation signal domain-containing protein [Streptomyces sp. 5K101]
METSRRTVLTAAATTGLAAAVGAPGTHRPLHPHRHDADSHR